jgi:hypothetical protein
MTKPDTLAIPSVGSASVNLRRRQFELDNGPEWETHGVAIAREFETFRMFEIFPATVTEAAALFERLAQPLDDGDDFTVIEHAIELWKGGGGQLPSAKEWAARMAAALKRITAP